jgi:hypothetical protein
MESSAYNKQSEPPKKHSGDPCKCDENDTATRKSVNTLRQVYCTALDTAKSNRDAAAKDFEQKAKLFEEKKRLMMWTEKNYRLYRDIDIVVDTRLQATNDTFKTNVAAYNTESTALYTQLKAILTSLKDVKTKVSALRDQASNLENYKNDQCNASQWALLTGKNMDNCKPDPNGPPIERPEACKDADKVYHELIAIPKKCLVFDVNYLVKSAADIVGIQTFSNIAALTVLQSNLSDAGKAFITAIQAAAKARAADLVTVQADLITTVTDTTVSGISKFTAISDCDAAYATLEFLCKPDCHCVERRDGDECQPRLHKCECEICEICSEVKNTYCEAGKEKPVIS